MLYLYAYNLISALFKMKFVVGSDGWLCSRKNECMVFRQRP